MSACSPTAKNRATVAGYGGGLRLTRIGSVAEPMMPSISAIARDWGTSRPYVSKCVHQRGCPTTSLRAAREWREYCASKRPPTNPKQIARLLEEDDADLKTSPESNGSCNDRRDNPPPPSLDSLHDALEAAIAAQEQASSLLQEATGEATDSKMAMLLAVHNKTLELRLRAEAQYRDALKIRLEQ